MSDHDHSMLIQSYVDGELATAAVIDLEHHLAACEPCRAQSDAVRALKASLRTSDLYYSAPAGLENRIRAAVRPDIREHAPSGRPKFWNSVQGIAAAAAIVAVGFFIVRFNSSENQQRHEQRLVAEAVSSHIRSLLANHLADVPSTDQHTVKPWFAGKLDFAPPVKDLAASGFPLVGGRLDYLNHRTVAALIYRDRQHVINLFIWPEKSADTPVEVEQTQGYNICHWNSNAMTFWAVSDVNAAELQRLAETFRH